MNWRDTAERLFWTFVAGTLGSLGVGVGFFDLTVWEAALSGGATALSSAVLLLARQRLAILPSPGEGLPGLPTHEG